MQPNYLWKHMNDNIHRQQINFVASRLKRFCLCRKEIKTHFQKACTAHIVWSGTLWNISSVNHI